MNEDHDTKTKSMISIKVSKGIPYIWDQEGINLINYVNQYQVNCLTGLKISNSSLDWLKLRTEYRIMGGLDGPVGNGLGGRVRFNLPMRLSNVEAQYLVAQGIAKTLHAPNLYDENPLIDSETLNKTLQDRRQKQVGTKHVIICKQQRKNNKLVAFDNWITVRGVQNE